MNVIIGIAYIAIKRQKPEDIICGLTRNDAYRYALCIDTPIPGHIICVKTYKRFLNRCTAYEEKTGRDLIDECFTDLTSRRMKITGIGGDQSIMRIDSLMIPGNVRTLTRLQLIYTVCRDMVFKLWGLVKRGDPASHTTIPFRNPGLSLKTGAVGDEYTDHQTSEDPDEEADAVSSFGKNAAKDIQEVAEIIAQTCPNLPRQLYHFAVKSDHNNFLYHDKGISWSDKEAPLLSDLQVLLEFCGDDYVDNKTYQLLKSAADEQCMRMDNGSLKFKAASIGEMGSGILQNPSVPESTYCKKDGKSCRGDKAAIIEQSSNNGDSLIVGCAFGSDNESDYAQGAKAVSRLTPEQMLQKIRLVGDALFHGPKWMQLWRKPNSAL